VIKLVWQLESSAVGPVGRDTDEIDLQESNLAPIFAGSAVRRVGLPIPLQRVSARAPHKSFGEALNGEIPWASCGDQLAHVATQKQLTICSTEYFFAGINSSSHVSKHSHRNWTS
jgi:hypothetical protein